jgi:hypothetical protein
VDLGFETIGNACLICHDGGPVLATDPWIKGSAYFGSWTTSHEIPPEQQAHVKACKYLWISHGHPDHLSQESLAELKDKELLLADHFGVQGGGRIARELREQGFKVRVLADGVWTWLSPRMRVLSLADYNQDAVLLVDLGGRLLVDSNDASDNGGGAFVRSIVQQYEQSYLLALTGYGDADMINFFDEQGRRIPPGGFEEGSPSSTGSSSSSRRSASRATSRSRRSTVTSAPTAPGRTSARRRPRSTRRRSRHAASSSSRSSAVSTSRATTCARSTRPRAPGQLFPPEQFGDHWSDELEPADVAKIRAYFARFAHLKTFLGTVNFRVGGKDNVIEIDRRHPLGITFETPRASLMTVIEYEIFDDLMIGNFTKTTLHGPVAADEHARPVPPTSSPS